MQIQQDIKQAKALGKKLAISIFELDKPTARYRCYNPYLATKSSKSWQLVYFNISELQAIISALDQADLLILMRVGDSPNLQVVIKAARARGLKIVYEIDDRICHHSFLPDFKKALEMTDEFYKGMKDHVLNLEAAAVQADAFLTTTPFLAGDLEKAFHKPVQVVQNSINKKQLTASRQANIKKTLKRNIRPPKTFHIGYFSGSATHNADFNLIAEPLADFLRAHSDARLLLAGRINTPSALGSVESQIEHIDFTDYQTLQKHIANVDVNLAPLTRNRFTDSKSELKYFEAAIVNVPTIASPTATFAAVIKNDENGFLCFTDSDWRNTLEKLYKDPSLRKNIAKTAKKHAMDNYYGATYLRALESAYDAFIKL